MPSTPRCCLRVNTPQMASKLTGSRLREPGPTEFSRWGTTVCLSFACDQRPDGAGGMTYSAWFPLHYAAGSITRLSTTITTSGTCRRSHRQAVALQRKNGSKVQSQSRQLLPRTLRRQYRWPKQSITLVLEANIGPRQAMQPGMPPPRPQRGGCCGGGRRSTLISQGIVRDCCLYNT